MYAISTSSVRVRGGWFRFFPRLYRLTLCSNGLWRWKATRHCGMTCSSQSALSVACEEFSRQFGDAKIDTSIKHNKMLDRLAR